MTVSFEGIGENVVTFMNSATTPAEAGYPVKMSASATVNKATANGRFMGVCLSADSGFAGVRVKGYVKMTYTGTAPTVGWGALVATGDKSVKADAASPAVGSEYLIVDVDTTAKTVGFIL